MKIQKRNIATIILAILCAIALAIGVSFVAPKVEKISARADTSSKVTWSSDGCYQYYEASAPNNGMGKPISFSSMVLGMTAYGACGFGSSGNTATATLSKTTTAKAQVVTNYVRIKAEVTVPAYTEYTVEYIGNMSMTEKAEAGGTYVGWMDLYAYGDADNSENMTFGYIDEYRGVLFESGYSGECEKREQLQVNATVSGNTETKTSRIFKVNYANNTGKDKTFTAYFGVYTADIPSTSLAYSYSASLTMTCDITVTSIKVPTSTLTSEMYDGNAKTFNFTYYQLADYTTAYANIVPSVISAEYADGSTINSSTYKIGNLDVNGIPTSYNGTFNATEAGTYVLRFDLTADAIANEIEWEGVQTLTFTIKPQPIAVPTVQNSPTPYNADVQEFALSGFNSDIMSVADSDSTSNVTGATVAWDPDKEVFKATEAATYTVFFHMDSANYIWDVGNGTTADQSRNLTISKKELKFTTSPSVNLSWDLGDKNATLTVTASASPIENPDFELELYYVKGTDTTNHITAGINGTTLTIADVAAADSYTLCAVLKTSNTANRNYCIEDDVYKVAFTIGSGAIDYSVIDWYYRQDGSQDLNDLYASDGSQNVIRYQQDVTSGAVINYYLSANIAQKGYLSIADDYSKGNYVGGLYTFMETDTGITGYNKGCSAVGTYKTRIVLNTDANHIFDDDHKLDDDGLQGWYEIEWTISKGVVDSDYLDNLTDHLQYKVGATGSWQTYDPDNPPEYGLGSITVQIDPNSYGNNGITGAVVSFGANSSGLGEHPAQVTFTYDPNYENAGQGSFTWEIAKQSINVDWTPDYWTAANGDEFQIRVLNIADNLKQYVQYEYYLANSDLTMGSTRIGIDENGLQMLVDNHGASLNEALAVYVKVTLKSNGTNYRLVDKTGNQYECALLYELGSNNTVVYVTLSETTAEYGSSAFNAGILSMTDSSDDSEFNRDLFVERIYVVASDGTDLGDWDSFDFAKATAGTYTVRVELNEDGEQDYVLSYPNGRTFTITPKAIPVPTLSEIVFNNTYIDLTQYLGGSYLEYKNIIQLGGTYDGVKKVGSYTVTLTLLDSNYCWDYGTDASPVKAALSYSLADDVVWSGSTTVANCGWSITPYVLTSSGWNLSGKEGAVYYIPAALLDGLDVDVSYLYHTDKASYPLGDGESLEAGSTYFVKAQLIGADAGNFVFADSNTTTSDFATYKIPQSGISAFANSVREFMTGTLLGLPVWAWFLIGLALLILLIIIIVVAVKRRKTKEQREEIKAKKEEEKQRKEEERQRREEERQAQKERLEAERELAKAKQEAELEKIRAQAGMGMAGAGMATMAMQQQPQPQSQPQPAPQYAPMQQPYDNGVLARIEADLAEIKARQNMGAGYAQAPMQMPMPMPMQMPMAMPQYMPMPQPQSGSAGGGDMMSLMQTQLAEMRAEQNSALKTELEIMKLRMDQKPQQYAMPQQFEQAGAVPNGDMEKVGALAVAIWRKMNSPAPATAIPQSAEESTQSVPAQYPSDAVITTTTTVDTTKSKPVTRTREDNSDFDVDGFYDEFK